MGRESPEVVLTPVPAAERRLPTLVVRSPRRPDDLPRVEARVSALKPSPTSPARDQSLEVPVILALVAVLALIVLLATAVPVIQILAAQAGRAPEGLEEVAAGPCGGSFSNTPEASELGHAPAPFGPAFGC